MGNLKRRILTAAAVFFALNAVGAIGYWYISGQQATLLDAWFMAVTTLSSVGFGEITPNAATPFGRAFTIILIYSGMVTLIFVTTSFTALIVEGELSRLLEKRRMEKRLAALKDHYVACGVGATGFHVARELIQTGRPFAFIELTEERAQLVIADLRTATKATEFCYVVGDATDDDVLQRAGIVRAAGLVAALPGDKDNLFLTLTARQMNPTMRIIARATHPQSIDKLKRAGAQSVVSPTMIGGMRMVSELVRPSVVTFLDLMLRDRDKNMRIEEVTVRGNSPLLGKTLSESHLRQEFGCSVLAVRASGDAPFDYNPAAETAMSQGTVLIVLGSADRVQRLRETV